MRGCFWIASAQALAIATGTDTPFFFAAEMSAPGCACSDTRKVGMVSDAVIEWLTAFSIDVIGRPTPGTCTSGMACAGMGAMVAAGRWMGCAFKTSSATISPLGPLPRTLFKFTCSSPASLRAYGEACLLSGRDAGLAVPLNCGAAGAASRLVGDAADFAAAGAVSFFEGAAPAAMLPFCTCSGDSTRYASTPPTCTVLSTAACGPER